MDKVRYTNDMLIAWINEQIKLGYSYDQIKDEMIKENLDTRILDHVMYGDKGQNQSIGGLVRPASDTNNIQDRKDTHKGDKNFINKHPLLCFFSIMFALIFFLAAFSSVDAYVYQSTTGKHLDPLYEEFKSIDYCEGISVEGDKLENYICDEYRKTNKRLFDTSNPLIDSYDNMSSDSKKIYIFHLLFNKKTLYISKDVLILAKIYSYQFLNSLNYFWTIHPAIMESGDEQLIDRYVSIKEEIDPIEYAEQNKCETYFSNLNTYYEYTLPLIREYDGTFNDDNFSEIFLNEFIESSKDINERIIYIESDIIQKEDSLSFVDISSVCSQYNSGLIDRLKIYRFDIDDIHVTEDSLSFSITNLDENKLSLEFSRLYINDNYVGDIFSDKNMSDFDCSKVLLEGHETAHCEMETQSIHNPTSYLDPEKNLTIRLSKYNFETETTYTPDDR